jgi:hypothetical protein
MDMDLLLKPKEIVLEKLSFQRYGRWLWFRIPKVAAEHLRLLDRIQELHQRIKHRNVQVNMHRV